MYHASRFYYVDDIFHRLFEVATLVPLATAVLHIRTVPILSDPKNNVDMFAFSLCIAIAHALELVRKVEIIVCQKYFQTEGLYEEAFRHSRRDFFWTGVPTCFFLAAAVYSGVKFYGYDSDDSDEGRALAAAKETTGNTSTIYEDDVAICLNLAGALMGPVVMAFTLFVYFGGPWSRNLDVKEYFVPMNIDYSIHRYGEWVMLLLGESVLSLLIVTISDGYEYYKTFFSGVITVILLEYLHFKSQPHDPDFHALRKSRYSGFFYTNLLWVYSASLVILGTSYKMFLYEFVYEDDNEEHRALFPIFNRFLAAETTALRFETADRQQRIAHFFSGSLALVFLCLDLMILAHRGVKPNMDRLKKGWKIKILVALLVALRLAIIVFVGTVSQYITDPAQLAGMGVGCVFLQLACRVLLNFVIPDEIQADQNALERAATHLNARGMTGVDRKELAALANDEE